MTIVISANHAPMMIASHAPIARTVRTVRTVSVVLLVVDTVRILVDTLRCNASNGKSAVMVDTIVRLLGFPLVRRVDACSKPARFLVGQSAIV